MYRRISLVSIKRFSLLSSIVGMACMLFISNIYGCAGRSTSYVKPSISNFKTIRNLTITVDGNPELTHVGAVANESFWLTMAGGPVVDVVVGNVRDFTTAKSMGLKDMSSNYRMMFIDALDKNVHDLKNTMSFDSINVTDGTDAKSLDNTDGVLTLTIVNWGTRANQRGSDRIIPFMNVKTSMVRTSDGKLIWAENRTITNDSGRVLNDYQKQNDLVDRDFTSLINKAAKEVAVLLGGA